MNLSALSKTALALCLLAAALAQAQTVYRIVGPVKEKLSVSSPDQLPAKSTL